MSSREREAPSEARTAISPMRVDPRASIKFATFTLAINSTSTVETSRIVSGRAHCRRFGSDPRSPGVSTSVLARNRSISCSGQSVSSGASISLRMAPIRPVDRRGRLLERNAGLQTREQIRPVALAIVMVGEGFSLRRAN